MNDYTIRFAPVAGTGDGRLYSVNGKASAADAIKVAKIRHSMDFGFMNVREVITSVKVFDWDTRTWTDITAEALATQES
jgi:hypothetical protein